MKAKIEIDLKPFQVPNYVITEQLVGQRGDGYRESPKYALNELPYKVLETLCKEFTKSIMEKAGYSTGDPT